MELSRSLDSALEQTKGGGLPAELTHFVVAERFSTDPRVVYEEWPEEMIEDALAVMAAETRYHSRHAAATATPNQPSLAGLPRLQ